PLPGRTRGRSCTLAAATIPPRLDPFSRRTFMKAAVVGEHGVEIRDLPKPEPKPSEVLIRVRASSLNRADLLVSQGHQHGAVGGPGSNAPARSRRSAARCRASSRATA